MKARKAFAGLLAVLIGLPLAAGAEIRGRLRLYVADTAGNPIPGVKITLVSAQASVITREITTNDSGVATHGSMENHWFEVTFEKKGYLPLKKRIKIPLGELYREDIVLRTPEDAAAELLANSPRAQAINLYNEGAQALKQEEYERALGLFKESIALDATIHQAQYEAGRAGFLLGKYDEAAAFAEAALQLKPDYVVAYRLLAAIYEKKGDMEKSAAYTKLAQEKGGVTGIDRYNDAVKHMNDGDVDAALPLLEEAVELDPDLADAHYQLGLVYLNKAENGKAILSFEKYLELRPKGENAETARSILQYLKK